MPVSSSPVPVIFCQKSVRQKRKRAQKYIETQDPLKKYIETTLLEKWRDFSFFDKKGRYLFHGFTSLLNEIDKIAPKKSIFSDIIDRQNLTPLSFLKEKFVVLEEEKFPFKENTFNSICSTQSLHFVNDIPGALVQARSSLKKNGVYIASFLGVQTAQEIKALLYEVEDHFTGKVLARFHPLIESTEMPPLLQRVGFFNPIIETETIDISYTSLESLLFHLRQENLTSSLIARNKGFTSPRLMEKVSSALLKKISFPLNIPYEIIYISAQAGKHS